MRNVGEAGSVVEKIKVNWICGELYLTNMYGPDENGVSENTVI